MARWKLPDAPQRATNKVDMPNSVNDLYGTRISQWYVVRRGSKNGYQKDMRLEKVGPHAQNMITIPDSIINITGGTYITS